MNKKIIIGICVGVIALGATVSVFTQKGTSYGSYKEPVSTATETVASTSLATYNLALVATHKTASSCWTTIAGEVYDLTPWIANHPGGEEAILSLCGIDGTASFNDQHGGQARPERELAKFHIGALVK